MQNEHVVAALQLFTIILIVGICTARIVQLRSELKEFKGWSWRKPGDNRKRLLMLLFWPVGSMICTGLLCGLLNSIYLISLTAQFEHIVYYVAPYYMYMIIPMGCSFYGLIEHMVVRNKMGDQALDLLFWAGEPPVRTSAALLDDFRNYPVTEPYIERVRGMDLLQKSCIVLAVFVCIFSLLFIPKEMGYLYMVADNRLIYIDERGSIERIYNLDQLYSIDYAEKNENWTLCFSDGKSWTISHDGIINAVKQVTGIVETIVE